MKKMTFFELANKVLTDERRPLSPSEMWKIAVSKSYDKQLSSRGGKTPWSTLYSVVFLDQRDNPDTKFIKVGARPARYYLKTLPEAEQLGSLE